MRCSLKILALCQWWTFIVAVPDHHIVAEASRCSTYGRQAAREKFHYTK